MALNAGTLGGEIKAAIISSFGSAEDDTQLSNFCNKLAEAIVDHIVANAEVTASGSDPQGGQVDSTGTIS